MYATFNRFEIKMTKEQAKSASHQGQCIEDVEALMENKKYMHQFKKIDKDDIRAELKEYGCWDDEELTDEIDNVMKITWIAAGNIVEELES